MSSSVWGNDKTQFFDSLTPDKVLDAVESLGFQTTGRLMPLASMENRVYEVEIENPSAQHVSENFKIFKFYRPGRWSQKQIQDEHDFLFDLQDQELHVIAPDKIKNQSVFVDPNGLYFTCFPKMGGRACDEWNEELLGQMGRLLGRLHAVGKTKSSQARLSLDIKTFGENNLQVLEKSRYLPGEYRAAYSNLCHDVFALGSPLFKGINFQRIHGDCHHGNILLNEGRPFMIDFDDMSQGPCVQDIWMVIPGRDEESLNQRNILLDAYLEMNDFNFQELKLIEILRSLRIIHFSAWISLRYEDQSFQRAFPQYGTTQYWEEEMAQLREQLSLLKDLNVTY